MEVCRVVATSFIFDLFDFDNCYFIQKGNLVEIAVLQMFTQAMKIMIGSSTSS